MKSEKLKIFIAQFGSNYVFQQPNVRLFVRAASTAGVIILKSFRQDRQLIGTCRSRYCLGNCKQGLNKTTKIYQKWYVSYSKLLYQRHKQRAGVPVGEAIIMTEQSNVKYTAKHHFTAEVHC
jgi:hypothetical protein